MGTIWESDFVSAIKHIDITLQPLAKYETNWMIHDIFICKRRILSIYANSFKFAQQLKREEKNIHQFINHK